MSCTHWIFAPATRIGATSLLCLLLLFLSNSALGVTHATVQGADVNLRTSSSRNSAAIKLLRRGTSLTIIGSDRSGQWMRVRLPDGRVGWVKRQYLKMAAGRHTTKPVQSKKAKPPDSRVPPKPQKKPKPAPSPRSAHPVPARPSPTPRPSPVVQPRTSPRPRPVTKPKAKPRPPSSDVRRPTSDILLPPLLTLGSPPPGEDVRRARRLAMSPGGDRIGVLEESREGPSRFLQFDTGGALLGEFPLSYPWVRGPEEWDRISLALDDQGHLFTNARSAQVIEKFSPDGKVLGTLGEPTAGSWTDLAIGNGDPTGKAVPASLYGLDGPSRLVKVLDPADGKLLKVYFITQVRSPHRLALDEGHRQFFILDYAADGSPVTSYHVAGDGATVRQSPSPSSPALGQLAFGEVPRVLDSQKGEPVAGNDHWYRIALDDRQVGFVSATLLQAAVVNGSIWRYPFNGEMPVPYRFSEPLHPLGPDQGRRYWDPTPVQHWQGLRLGRDGILYLLVKTAPTRETPSLQVFEVQPDVRAYRMSRALPGGPASDLVVDREGYPTVIGADGIPVVMEKDSSILRRLGAGPLDTASLLDPRAAFCGRQGQIYILDRAFPAVTVFGSDGSFQQRRALPVSALERELASDLVVDDRGRVNVVRVTRRDHYLLQSLTLELQGPIHPARTLASGTREPGPVKLMIDGAGRRLVRGLGTALSGPAFLRLYDPGGNPLAEWADGTALHRDLPEAWRRQLDRKTLQLAALDDRTYLYLWGRESRNPSRWRLIQAIVTDDAGLQVTRELRYLASLPGVGTEKKPVRVTVPPLPQPKPPDIRYIGHDRRNNVYAWWQVNGHPELLLFDVRGRLVRKARPEGSEEARDLAVDEEGNLWMVDRLGVKKYRIP